MARSRPGGTEMRSARIFLLICAAVAFGAQGASAQDAAKYPDQPVRMVVPFSAGSMTDLLARVVSESLAQRWKQQAIVENRPGLAGTSSVAKRAAAGDTLVVQCN